MLGWTLHPFLEEMALLFTALAHCELNHLGEFFTRLVRRGNKRSMPRGTASVMKEAKEEIGAKGLSR